MSAMYSMCGDCGSDVPGFHTRGCSKWTPPVSETAAWTEQDEESLREWASEVYEPQRGDLPSFRKIIAYAREILRLRADIEAEVARRAFYEASMGVANGKLYDAEDEIARLRAENERMVDAMHEANAKLYHEAESLRVENDRLAKRIAQAIEERDTTHETFDRQSRELIALRAPTRERETPPDDSQPAPQR